MNIRKTKPLTNCFPYASIGIVSEVLPNSSLSAWRQEVAKYDLDLAARMEENLDPYAVAKNLGLRVPEYRRFDTIRAFLNAPHEGLQPLLELGITTFYAGARAAADSLASFRNVRESLSAEQVVPFIKARVEPVHYDSYNLRVAEFLSGVCVVAQISRSGNIWLDIACGTLPPLTGGQISPEFIATNEPSSDNLTGKLRYYKFIKGEDDRIDIVFLPPEDETSALNTSVRAAIWESLRSLPPMAGESDIYIPRLPGRYEFAVVNHNGIDTAIFGDVQPFSTRSIE